VNTLNIFNLGFVVFGEPTVLGKVLVGKEDAVSFLWATKINGIVKGAEGVSFPLVRRTFEGSVVYGGMVM